MLFETAVCQSLSVTAGTLLALLTCWGSCWPWSLFHFFGSMTRSNSSRRQSLNWLSFRVCPGASVSAFPALVAAAATLILWAITFALLAVKVARRSRYLLVLQMTTKIPPIVSRTTYNPPQPAGTQSTTVRSSRQAAQLLLVALATGV